MNRLLLLIHIILLLISCNGDKNNSNKKVFKYNTTNGISSLDPAFARNQDNIWACHLLYNGLVQTDSNLQIKPAIAKHWLISDSGKKYTFILNRNVYFHDNEVFKNGQGRQVIAADFAYSLNRIHNAKTASPGAWIFNDKIGENGIYAVDDTTLVIELQFPFPPFLGMLTMPYCFVVPHEAIDKWGRDFGTHPLGTGPFVFKEWYDGVKLNLLKNEKYFEFEHSERLPFVDAVSISFIQSKQTEFLEFTQGRLDMFNSIESSFKDELLTAEGTLQPKYQGAFSLIKSPFLNTEYLAFNLGNSPTELTKDIHFRKALNYAIDRKKMMRFLRNNLGEPALAGFIPRGLPGFFDTIFYPYNLETAKLELEKSDYRKGAHLTLHTTKDYQDLCLYIQKQAALIGISIKVETLPSSLIKTEKSQGKLAFFRASWIADYPDAENYLSCFLSSNKAPNGPNYTFYDNNEYDQLYKTSLNENDIDKRILIFQKMNQILMKNAVVLPLFYDQSLRLYQNNISGVYTDALNSLNIKYIQKR
jgi:oligopeptide transport system substrate-binding protein